MGVQQSTEVENQMTSVERVIEYSRIVSEADLESKQPKLLFLIVIKLILNNSYRKYAVTNLAVRRRHQI